MMKSEINMTRIKFFILAFAVFASYASFADLVVDQAVIIITDPQQTRQDLVILNNDDEDRLFVEITPFDVINAGEEDESLEPIDFESSPEFLVTPNRAILEPENESIIRMLNLNHSGEKELVYRINVLPIAPPPELDTPAEDDSIQPLVEIVVGYQVLVIILPDSPEALLEYQREGNTINFSNNGNANYILVEGEQCNPADPSECQPLPIKRMYPGNNWQLDLPYDGPIAYTVRSHTGSSAQILD